MKRILLLIALVASLGTVSASGQMTAAGAFASAPQAVFPLLDRNTRLDMIDYYNAGQETSSTNALEGKSRITAMADRNLTVRMTDASVVQLFVLPAGNDTIVGVITTVATPGHDSSLSLYDRKWMRLTGRFTAPKLADWMVDRSRIGDVELVVPFMLTGYAYDDASSTLTLRNNLEGFLSKDIYSTVAPLMRKELVYRWDGKRFVPAK